MYDPMMYNSMAMYGAPMMANGMVTYQQGQRPAMTQPLTAEEMAILTEKGGAFSTKVTQEDMYKAYCSHKKNGAIVATQNPDGSFTCPICGETFDQRDMDKESIEEDVKRVLDDIQNIKLMYLDMPVDVSRQYFPIIPLLKKLPQLATIAAANWAKYDGSATAATNTANSAYGYAAYNQMLAGQSMYPTMIAGGVQPTAYPNGTTMLGSIPVNQGGGYVDANGNPMNPTGAYPVAGQVFVGPDGRYYTTQPTPQQTMMMPTPAANEFVAVGPTASVATMQDVNLGGSTQPKMAPVTYAPQPQPTPSGNPNVPQSAPAPNPAPPVVSQQPPEVDVKSFNI